MVNRNRFDEIHRTNAARVVQARLLQIAQRCGISVGNHIWNNGMGMKHAGPHCLSVRVNGIAGNVFFTDYELEAYSSQQNIKQLDSRLHQFISDTQETIDSLSVYDLAKNCWHTGGKTAGKLINKRQSRGKPPL